MHKRTILIVLLALLAFAKVDAQYGKVGFRFGSGISTFNGLDLGNSDFRYTPSVGLAFKFSRTKIERFALTTELYYTKKGARGTYNINNFFVGEIRHNLHYLEAPIILDIKIGPVFQIETGVYGSILLGSDFDFNGTFFNGFGDVDPNNLNDLDYGLVFGFGLSIPRGSISFRYTHGLNDVLGDEVDFPYLNGARNGTFSITVSRFFGFRARRGLP